MKQFSWNVNNLEYEQAEAQHTFYLQLDPPEHNRGKYDLMNPLPKDPSSQARLNYEFRRSDLNVFLNPSWIVPLQWRYIFSVVLQCSQQKINRQTLCINLTL